MKIYTTAREDYLKAILVLQNKLGKVRSIDISRYLSVSKPSVCRAISTLSDGGFAYMDDKYIIHLTDEGKDIAQKTYEKHCFFTNQLISIGVNPKTAEEDACKLEHAISEESFEKLKEKLHF